MHFFHSLELRCRFVLFLYITCSEVRFVLMVGLGHAKVMPTFYNAQTSLANESHKMDKILSPFKVILSCVSI